MGQEEVSEIRDLFASECNLLLWKPNRKDASASGKESYMKTNGKKRIFALLMCVMMIVASMSVLAASRYTTIGGTSSDRAECSLYLSSSLGQAFTTPMSPSSSVSTEIAVMDGDGVTYKNSGSTSASVSRSGLYAAGSSHRSGPYYTTLAI